MHYIKKHKNTAGAVLSFVALLGFLAVTSPSEDNFAISFVPLVLLWVTLYFLGGAVALYVFKSPRRAVLQMVRITVASAVTMLVMFGALGQLSLMDTFVLIALATLGSFYFSRTWRS